MAHKITKQRGGGKKKALAAIGRYASGVSDISEKHDDYLAKAFKAE